MTIAAAAITVMMIDPTTKAATWPGSSSVAGASPSGGMDSEVTFGALLVCVASVDMPVASDLVFIFVEDSRSGSGKIVSITLVDIGDVVITSGPVRLWTTKKWNENRSDMYLTT